MAVKQMTSERFYIGLSTDVKPSIAEPGVRFYEYDTFYTYVLDGSTWRQMPKWTHFDMYGTWSPRYGEW